MSEMEIAVVEPNLARLVPLRADQPQPGGDLADDEIEGHTLATAVSPRTELSYFLEGRSFPSFPGYAAVFEVERCGPAVADMRPGDRAFTMGRHRSFTRCRRSRAVPVPAALDSSEATLARLMSVSLSTLVTTKSRPPAKVLVTGLGPIGNLAAQAFYASGYVTAGCDPVASRRDLLIAAGIPALAEIPLEDPEYAGRVDLVVECSGHEKAVLDACRIVRKGGEVVMVGVPWRRRVDLQAHEILHEVFHRYVILRSGWEWEVPMDRVDFGRGSIMENLDYAMALLASGRIRTSDLAFRMRPEDATKAYSDLASMSVSALTVIFEWRQGS